MTERTISEIDAYDDDCNYDVAHPTENQRSNRKTPPPRPIRVAIGTKNEVVIRPKELTDNPYYNVNSIMDEGNQDSGNTTVFKTTENPYYNVSAESAEYVT